MHRIAQTADALWTRITRHTFAAHIGAAYWASGLFLISLLLPSVYAPPVLSEQTGGIVWGFATLGFVILISARFLVSAADLSEFGLVLLCLILTMSNVLIVLAPWFPRHFRRGVTKTIYCFVAIICTTLAFGSFFVMLTDDSFLQPQIGYLVWCAAYLCWCVAAVRKEIRN